MEEQSNGNGFGFALLGVLATLLLTAAPATAITYGQLDDGEHPYVGFMIFFDPTTPGWFSCSGTLLSPTVFLTAGHCTFNIGNDGEHVGTSGGNDVWVTFDDTEVLAGWPARADYPTEEALYIARSGWLNANPDYTKGDRHSRTRTTTISPTFPRTMTSASSSSTRMRRWRRSVSLPRLARSTSWPKLPQGRNNALIETVGYGIQSVEPHPQDVETRYKSTSRIVSLTGRAVEGRQRPHAQQPERGRWRRRVVLRRLGWSAAGQQHEPGGRRRVLRLQHHLPWRRLLVAGRHPAELRLHPAVPRLRVVVRRSPSG